MSQKVKRSCLKVITVLSFMLFFQVSYAQYNFDKVEDWMEDNLKDLGGRAVLMVYKDGKIVYQNDENHLSARQKRIGKFIAKRKGVKVNQDDFTPDTRLRIASCSKWLSAALVMTFVDEGKLNIEDSIGKFLPIFSKYGKGSIKLWHCLSHTTGIYQPELKEGIKEMTSFKTMDAAMETLAKEKMEGEAGKTFHYGNAGLQIAAAIIEKISGKSFETLFAERIAKPLNMKQTDFGKKDVPLAAGGAYSTTNDYMNFLIMILNKGMFNGKRVLSEQSIAAMQKNRIVGAKVMHSPAENTKVGYGFGEWIEKEENGVTIYVSSPGLFGSVPIVDVKNKYCAMLMTLNLKHEGRQQRNAELKKRLDEALGF